MKCMYIYWVMGIHVLGGIRYMYMYKEDNTIGVWGEEERRGEEERGGRGKEEGEEEERGGGGEG